MSLDIEVYLRYKLLRKRKGELSIFLLLTFHNRIFPLQFISPNILLNLRAPVHVVWVEAVILGKRK